jgi:hypothetical protein
MTNARRASRLRTGIRRVGTLPVTSLNAGVSLQALMAQLGHMSAEMSLRYGRLFDTTVRAEYERALALAKQQARNPATGRVSLPLADITGGADWKDTPLLKSRMAGGFCLRAPAQGACTYANICEHCPSYRAEPSSLPILAAQRVDAEALAREPNNEAGITHEHRHSGIVMHTPADVHYGRDHAIREARGRVLDAAHEAYPERYVRKPPEPPKLPGAVWINRPVGKEEPTQ